MEENKKKPIYAEWWLWTIIALVVVIVVLVIVIITGNASKSSEFDYVMTAINNQTENSTSTQTSTVKGVIEKKTHYTLGDVFTFDNFELTIGTNISYKTVDNRFSDYNGKTAIVLPVMVKNNGTETGHVNRFYLDYFGSQGTELSKVDAYFEDGISDTGDLRPGASKQAYFYLLYDGNGTYGIDFDNYKDKFSLEFNVEK